VRATVQPEDVIEVGALRADAVTDARMRSPACVPAGRLMAIDVAAPVFVVEAT
jgi:hypothetical protein